MDLPGDELLPVPDLTATRAISIAAPASAVWPWLTQLGQNRGGFYSHDWLENLIGLGIHSAETIRPELQVQELGETVDLAPGAGLAVVRLDGEQLPHVRTDAARHPGPRRADLERRRQHAAEKPWNF